jgi:hypothetical protein
MYDKYVAPQQTKTKDEVAFHLLFEIIKTASESVELRLYVVHASFLKTLLWPYEIKGKITQHQGLV